MMKNYQKPEAVYISLETEEAITNELGDTSNIIGGIVDDEEY